ncbi:MAG: hypothetical protein ACREII_07900 [Nitrospiraceae bacterium]
MRETQAGGSANVVVEAYAGYKGEETPRAFIHEGFRHEVREIEGRWYTDRHSYFKLCADDGQRYVLRYDMDDLIWELVMREAGR